VGRKIDGRKWLASMDNKNMAIPHRNAAEKEWLTATESEETNIGASRSHARS
jgi:hypothetical protein